MVASIWQRAAHRGVPIFLVTALLLGQSPMALAESPAQRQELVAALRQLDALERTVADSAARARSCGKIPRAPAETNDRSRSH